MNTAGLVTGRRFLRRLLIVGVALAAVGTAGAAELTGAVGGSDSFGNAQITRNQTAQGILQPTNQWITPIGRRIRPDNQSRIGTGAINPDGITMATLGADTYAFGPVQPLVIMDLQTGKVLQRTGYSLQGYEVGSTDPPVYSHDGKTLWVQNPEGLFGGTNKLVRFAVKPDGTVNVTPVAVIPLPGVPAGMTLSPDGSDLYVALNSSNTLGVISTATNQLIKQIPVGNAPRQVVLVGSRAFVSDEGGRVAKPGDSTDRSDGTPIVVHPGTAVPATGTVSVVDTAAAKVVDTISVGLGPAAEYLAGDGTLMVANSNDDSVSLIDPATDQVVQTFSTTPVPGAPVGSYPTAIAMPDPSHILVSIGRDNALAVYSYTGPAQPVTFLGLLPTDAYPNSIAIDRALNQVVITSQRGTGDIGPPRAYSEGPGVPVVSGYSVFTTSGTVELFPMPSDATLPSYTQQVFRDNDWNHLLQAPPPHTSTPHAVPRRLGDPSPIKHVFLIIKENRTYDQLLGDIGKANSDPSLAQFGRRVTPNTHALATAFPLFDNFYDSGRLSAEGHQWLTQAEPNDYLMNAYGAFFPRSYPFNGGDPLAYQPTGHIWDAAAAAGLTVANFGEYVPEFTNAAGQSATSGSTWAQWYEDSRILEGKATSPLPIPEKEFQAHADIPSLATVTDPDYPAFDPTVPDQYRADVWLQSFRQSEQTGKLANLNIFTLGDDHTAGVSPGYPYPSAQVADNDLAVGRIVQAISHSRFWKSSAIFVVEDDSLDGVDHVDGHRSILLTISPYARRDVVINHYYTQINVVKTIEQILGIAAMNQEDLAAEPIFDAFDDHPDLTPYDALRNQTPLANLAPTTAAAVAANVRGMYQQWESWSRKQNFAHPDLVNAAQFDRLQWYATHGWRTPYPGEHRILTPNQVPGAELPPGWLS
jgi:YVTN family beta-propeller protein